MRRVVWSFAVLAILLAGCQSAMDDSLSDTSSPTSAYLSPARDSESTCGEGEGSVIKLNGVDLVAYLELTDEQVKKFKAILQDEVEGREAMSFSTSKEKQLLDMLTDEQREKYNELLESGQGWKFED